MIRLALCLLLLTAGTRRVSVDSLGVHLVQCARPDLGVRMTMLKESLPEGLWPYAYRELADRPELVWVSFVVLSDTTFTWPRGVLPVLYAPERTMPLRAFMVGGPPQHRPVPLGVLDPGELWRMRWPCVNQVGSILFVGYPNTLNPDSASAVRLERPMATFPPRQ